MTSAAVPLFPCKDLDTTLVFYQALGFEVSHRQGEPYLYAALSMGETTLHFSRLSVYGAKNAFGSALVFVSELERQHRLFGEGLRAVYGKVPTAGLPRITRLHQPDRTRFKLFDPNGNMLIYIDRNEAEGSFDYQPGSRSELLQALENACFLRDVYSNDAAAAKVLDKALAVHPDAASLDRARALAARAELAVAMGEDDILASVQATLRQLPLTSEERERYADELRAAEQLQVWISPLHSE